MFNRYWRAYPYFLQMFLLVMMILTLFFAAIALGKMVTPMITGIPYPEIEKISLSSSVKVINAGRLFQLITSTILFIGTGFLYAYASHPRPMEYLGLRKIKKPWLIIIVLILFTAALPLLSELVGWIKNLIPNDSLQLKQKAAEEMSAALAQSNSVGILIFNILVMAIIPAVGEELLFRGVIMRFIHKRTRSITFSIVLSALVFALIHPQPYTFLSIFIMGMLLGCIYYYTGSLWVSMIAHFVNNGLQIFLQYLANIGIISKDMEQMESFPVAVLVVSSLIAVGAFYILKKNSTPLPKSWSNDYTEEELAIEKED